MDASLQTCKLRDGTCSEYRGFDFLKDTIFPHPPMLLPNGTHLTYCTNIHAGESWEEVFQSLQTYAPTLKKQLSPNAPFGIGLRLSDQASRDLMAEGTRNQFTNWLTTNDLYVSLINGFPYGGFHRQRVKDDVHRPDWTTIDRRDYTIRLAQILAELLPDGMEGGISTSPVSYRRWHPTAIEQQQTLQNGCLHLAEVVKELIAIRLEKDKIIHIDIEPEPDGMIDHVQDTVAFFNQKLIPIVTAYLIDNLSVKHETAEELARTHLQLCYDVCHFAVMYEDPAAAIAAFQKAGIGIGRVQISAALKADLPKHTENRQLIAQAFQNLSESTYLHQVSAQNFGFRTPDFGITQYPDLPEALPHIHDPEAVEWRTHFHVPVFVRDFGLLQSTQEDIEKIVSLQRQKPFTRHLEVETYTWEVLPSELKLDLLASIQREMEWVIHQFRINDF